MANYKAVFDGNGWFSYDMIDTGSSNWKVEIDIIGPLNVEQNLVSLDNPASYPKDHFLKPFRD